MALGPRQEGDDQHIDDHNLLASKVIALEAAVPIANNADASAAAAAVSAGDAQQAAAAAQASAEAADTSEGNAQVHAGSAQSSAASANSSANTASSSAALASASETAAAASAAAAAASEAAADVTLTNAVTLTNKTLASPTLTGQPILPAGSAAAPAVAFTGDTNTGIWSPAADTLAVSTGGTERLRVTSGGNVGIGTTPTVPLHVNGSAYAGRNTTQYIALTGDTGANFLTGVSVAGNAKPFVLRADTNSGELRLQNETTNPITIYTATTERFRLDSNGLITGTGTSLGAFTSYTPTLGGTGWAIGDGTLSFYYCQIGKIVHVRGFMAFGASSTYGSATLTLTTPVTPSSTGTHRPLAAAMFYDNSVGKYYAGQVFIGSDQLFNIYGSNAGANAEVSGLISTVPFAWAASDNIRFSFTYQAA